MRWGLLTLSKFMGMLPGFHLSHSLVSVWQNYSQLRNHRVTKWSRSKGITVGSCGLGQGQPRAQFWNISSEMWVPKSKGVVASGLLWCLRGRYSWLCSVKTSMLKVPSTKLYLGHNNLRPFKTDKKKITLLL